MNLGASLIGPLTMIADSWGMAVQGIRAIVESAIDRASKATGVDFGVLMKTAGREQAGDWLRHNVGARDAVLVKASRGAALEHLADALLDGPTGRPDQRLGEETEGGNPSR